MTTIPTRCPYCDRPLASQDDYDTLGEGQGEHLCWSAWGLQCEPVDWRSRAVMVQQRETVKMKIETLQQARQVAFTGAYRGLRSQRWRRCVDKRGEGRWYIASKPGLHCALGWLIPEERQRMFIGPHTVADAMRIVADPLRRWYYRGTSYEQGAFERFLYELLEAHDDSTCPASMRRAMHKIARRHGLTIPPPERVISFAG